MDSHNARSLHTAIAYVVAKFITLTIERYSGFFYCHHGRAPIAFGIHIRNARSSHTAITSVVANFITLTIERYSAYFYIHLFELGVSSLTFDVERLGHNATAIATN